jgi:hypothetical protein
MHFGSVTGTPRKCPSARVLPTSPPTSKNQLHELPRPRNNTRNTRHRNHPQALRHWDSQQQNPRYLDGRRRLGGHRDARAAEHLHEFDVRRRAASRGEARRQRSRRRRLAGTEAFGRQGSVDASPAFAAFGECAAAAAASESGWWC